MILPQDQSKADDSDHIFLAFASVLLAKIEEWTASQFVPVVHHSTTIFYEDSWPGEPESQGVSWGSPPIEEKKDYSSLVFSSSRDPIWASKEAQNCAKYWKEIVGNPFSDETLANMENLSAPLQTYLLLSQELVPPILDVLDHYNTFHPAQEQLLDRFHRFRDERADPNIYWDITVPLFKVFGDMQHEETLGSFRLSPFTAEDKTEIWSTFESKPLDQREAIPIEINAFGGTYFQLTTTRTEPQEIHYRRNAISEMFRKYSITNFDQISLQLSERVEELEDIITALRLTNIGHVQTLCLIERVRTVFDWKASASIYTLHNQHMTVRARWHDTPYTLHEADLSTVRICFDVLRRLRMQNGSTDKSHGQLSVALRRFNQAYNRESREDQIIDLAIALESCLLAGDKGRSKGEPLAARGAILLAGTRNPNQTKAFLQELYKVRNKIVHGGKLLSELGKHLTEFPTQCENMVRDILKEYVMRLSRSRKTLKSVNTELDTTIAKGGDSV